MSAKESGIDEVEAIQPGRELNRALSVQLTPQQFECVLSHAIDPLSDALSENCT